jgi:carbamoyltransferase
MILLGLCTMGTSSACIFRDGELVAAIEEERLSRIKNDGAFPLRAIADCLRIAGVSLTQVDAVCVYWRPWRLGTRIAGTLGKSLSSAGAMAAMSKRIVGALFSKKTTDLYPEATGRWADLFLIRKILTKQFGAFRGEIHFLDHHLTHQLYGEAMRDWPTCLTLSYDGGGEADSTVVSVKRDGRREDLKRIKWPNSLGHFYSFFTGYLGFRMLEGEYKMMGLAPYGDPLFKDLILEKALRLVDDGEYRLDTRLCDYHRALENDFPAAMRDLFGPPRDPQEEPTTAHRNLAASVQAAFEAAQRHILAWAKVRCPDIERLVLSGGCALNVTANGRVLQAGLFKEIIVPPAPHDAGCAVGAVLGHLGAAAFHAESVRSPYLGPAFSDDQIAAAFRSLGLQAPRQVTQDQMIATVVDTLVQRGIVAWFQGRTEFGPRALGSRSFLADPRDDSIREEINRKIKKRELFRPFAPSTTTESCAAFFELEQESPYMNILARVRPEKQAVIPAVTHVDGTARVHSVSAESNPLYHRLITAFGRRTGVPVLLNTSFNIQEPIVNRPEEAIRTFLGSDVDLLAIGNYLCDRAWRAEAGPLRSAA